MFQSLQGTYFWCSQKCFWSWVHLHMTGWLMYEVRSLLHEPASHTPMKSNPIKNVFNYIKSFSKNLCLVGSVTVSSKNESILANITRKLKSIETSRKIKLSNFLVYQCIFRSLYSHTCPIFEHSLFLSIYWYINVLVSRATVVTW